MDHFHGDGQTSKKELQLCGHTNSNRLEPLPSSSSASTSEGQILYMPITTPPTPAPSPRPADSTIHFGFQPHHASTAPPLLFPSLQMHHHSLRRQCLSSIIHSCTPEELLFISQTIGPLIKREFFFSLPEELVLHVLSFVDDVKTLLNASLVNKQWLRIARDESIWKAMAIAYGFEDLEEAEEEWRQRQEKNLYWRIRKQSRRSNMQASSTEEPVPLQDEGENSPLSTPPDASTPTLAPFSYRRFFRDTCIINTNWRRGGKLLQSHRLPIISPDSGTVTSLALDRKWLVIGLANSMIKVYNTRTGLLVRTLRGHDSGVWSVCLVSQGGYRLPGPTQQPTRSASGSRGDDGGAHPRKSFVKGKRKRGAGGVDSGGMRKKDKSKQKDQAMPDKVKDQAMPDEVKGQAMPDKVKGQAMPDKVKSSSGKGVDNLPSQMAGLSVDSTRNVLHVMPDESKQHFIPQAMKAALGLDTSIEGDRKEESGSSSESASEDDAKGKEGASSSRGGYPPTWHYSDEEEEEEDVIREAMAHEKPFNMTYSSHGWGQPNSIIVSGGCDKVVRVWDLKSGQCIYVLHGHLSTIRSLRVLNNRPIAVTGSRDTSLRVWDVQVGRCLRVLEGHQASVRCLDVFGNRVVSGSYDYTCRLWNINTGECLHVLAGHFSQIYSVAFDGVRIASGGLDTTVRIWDAETGQCIALLQGHTALVCQLQLSPTMLATGGSDGRVITFSLETYKVLHRIAAHDSSVTSLQFNKNFLLTGGNDGRVRVYETATGAFVRDFSEPSESVWKAAFVRGTCAVMCKRADKTVVEIWSLNPKTSRKRAS